jgi:hypothetical protein
MCHMARRTMDMLKKFFGDRFILKELWPPQFPHLTYSDLYCRVFLKNVCTEAIQEAYNKWE